MAEAEAVEAVEVDEGREEMGGGDLTWDGGELSKTLPHSVEESVEGFL